MNSLEEINILWEGPFSKDEILENKIDSTKYEVKSNSIGLYQIYGSHPLYGDGVLVYIGRTKDKNGFKSRLKNRWVIEHGNDSENIKIYLGTIYCDTCKLEEEDIKKKIEKSEVLLINAMKPAFNSSNIQSVKDELIENRFIVYNRGNYRSLYPILDSGYFWKEHKNYGLVDKLAKELDIKIEHYNFDYGLELNDKFGFKSDYKIWFGVDYAIWDEKKIPLCLEVYSDDEKKMKKLKKLNSFDIYPYEDDGERTLYYKYIDIQNKDLDFNQTIKSLIEEIKEKM